MSLEVAPAAPGPEDAEPVLRRLDAPGRIAWALNRFPSESTIVSTSFGVESAVLLHLATRIRPDVRVVFLDAGFHFRETLAFRDRLTALLGLNLEIHTAPPPGQLCPRGQPWGVLSSPGNWCGCRKLEAMERALVGVRLWISGLRWDQTPERAEAPLLQAQGGGLFKLNPIADWSRERAWDYLRAHGLPVHPLHAEGYGSVGCWPCTRPWLAAEDPRSGRWAGEERTECGLHTFIPSQTLPQPEAP